MIRLPKSVTDWLTNVFHACNREAASKLMLVPNGHEPWLDFAIIENLQRFSSPYKFKSDWIVSIDTHWLGQTRLWPPDDPRWEIADIGFLVMMRTKTKLIRSKVALLQSKRLYALKQKPETAEEIGRYYWRGFSRMYVNDMQFEEMTRPRLFAFSGKSEYAALVKGSEQWERVERYEHHREVPVYYLLYNPLVMPHRVSIPHEHTGPLPYKNQVGCRVVPCRHIRAMMAKSPDNSSPTFLQLTKDLPAPFDAVAHRGGWTLEHFVVDLLLGCRTGRIIDLKDDEGLYGVFYRRTAPIQAAIAVTIDAPEGFEWAVEPDVAQ